MKKTRDYTKDIPGLVEATGWSVQELAERVGCGWRSMYRYINGEIKEPQSRAVKKNLDALLDSFGV